MTEHQDLVRAPRRSGWHAPAAPDAPLRRCLQTQQAAASALAACASLGGAVPHILRAHCTAFGWEVGELWCADAAARGWRRVSIWHARSTRARAYAALTRGSDLAPGAGRPGGLGTGGRPVWVPDVARAPDPWAAAAARSGLRRAFGVPVRFRGEALGAFLFRGRELTAPGRPLRGSALAVARQVGQALVRERAEAALRQAQRLALLGRLAAGVAHDFNNLLTVIGGQSQVLLERLGPDDPAGTPAREIAGACERAAMVRRLLTFCRRGAPAPAVLDLNPVVADMGSLLRRLLGGGVELITALTPGLYPVRADEGQVEQVLLNLVVNARDAMPGGGRVTVETANVDLGAGVAGARPAGRPGAYAMLAVSDTGCGMDEDTQAHLFEPFFTTKGAGRGTGLGLATVADIARQGGGHVTVDSAVNRGSTFRVYWPRAESPAR